MHKIIIRFVALILVPCLIADPVTVPAVNCQSTVVQTVNITISNQIFEDQAITGFLVQGWTRLGQWKFKRSIEVRRDEGLGSAVQPARNNFAKRHPSLVVTATLAISLILGLISFTWFRLKFDPYYGASYSIASTLTENRLERPIEGIQVQDVLTAIHDLTDKPLSYEEIVLQCDWITKSLWHVPADLNGSQLNQLLAFLENPSPTKSSTVSSRWVADLLKTAIMDRWLTRVYDQSDPYSPTAEAIRNSAHRLLGYQEGPVVDPLFHEYFPADGVNPQSILSEMVQIEDQYLVRDLGRSNTGPSIIPHSKPFAVVDNLFRTYGTVEDIDNFLNEIHRAETAPVIEIPIGQVGDVEAIRKLDPALKTDIETSAMAHHDLPPRLLAAVLATPWKRSYCFSTIAPQLVQRHVFTQKEVDWLKRELPYSWQIYEWDPDVMAFIGGVILNGQSTTGIARLRPIWVWRNRAFDRLGMQTRQLSMRHIAWDLWKPDYSVEALAKLWEVLTSESQAAVTLGREGKSFDTSSFTAETHTRLFVEDDGQRTAYYKFAPPPSVFELRGEAWLNTAFHPVEIEQQDRREGGDPYGYLGSRGLMLPTQLLIARSGVFGTKGQKAIITGITSESDAAKVRTYLKSSDPFIRDAAKQAIKAFQEKGSSKTINSGQGVPATGYKQVSPGPMLQPGEVTLGNEQQQFRENAQAFVAANSRTIDDLLSKMGRTTRRGLIGMLIDYRMADLQGTPWTKKELRRNLAAVGGMSSKQVDKLVHRIELWDGGLPPDFGNNKPDYPPAGAPPSATAKPMGSAIRPADIAAQLVHLRRRLLTAQETNRVQGGLRRGNHAATALFQKAFPHFPEELWYVLELFNGASIETVLSQVRSKYRSARPAPDIRGVVFEKAEGGLIDPDTRLPFPAVSFVENRLLHVLLFNSESSLFDDSWPSLIYQELAEHLFLPLDPTLSEEQRRLGVEHTLASLAMAGFAASPPSIIHRRQLNRMDLSSKSGHAFFSLQDIADRTLSAERDIERKFPLGSRWDTLNQWRRAYAMTYANVVQTKANDLRRENLLNTSPAEDPLDPLPPAVLRKGQVKLAPNLRDLSDVEVELLRRLRLAGVHRRGWELVHQYFGTSSGPNLEPPADEDARLLARTVVRITRLILIIMVRHGWTVSSEISGQKMVWEIQWKLGPIVLGKILDDQPAGRLLSPEEAARHVPTGEVAPVDMWRPSPSGIGHWKQFDAWGMCAGT